MRDKQDADRAAQDEEEKADREWWAIKVAGVAALLAAIAATVATLQLAMFREQLKYTIKAVEHGTNAANAARDNARTNIRSTVPYLSPLLSNFRHPIDADGIIDSFTAEAFLVFENYGKTPAAIREVRAKLFLTADADPPPRNFDELPVHRYEITVPAETKRDEAVKVSAVHIKQKIDASHSEFLELLAEASETKTFKRMGVIGKVTYDDMIGLRHVRVFCVKARMVPTGDGKFGLFQTIVGGPAYNKVTSKKIPKKDHPANAGGGLVPSGSQQRPEGGHSATPLSVSTYLRLCGSPSGPHAANLLPLSHNSLSTSCAVQASNFTSSSLCAR